MNVIANRGPALMRRSDHNLGGLLALGFALVFPVAAAQAAQAGPFELGPKVVTEHKVKSVVGPSVQIDDAGALSLAWMEEDKEAR